MSALLKFLEKHMPLFEILSKIKRLFFAPTSFWSISRILVPYLISQLFAISFGEWLNKSILNLIQPTTPSWLEFILKFLAEYFNSGGNWLYVGIILFIIILMIFVQILDKEERTKHSLFFLAGFVLLFGSILLYVLPMHNKNLISIENKQDKILKNKETEKYLIQRIKVLEDELSNTRFDQASGQQNKILRDQINELKTKLYTLQINDKYIDEAQSIIESGEKGGITKALKLIEKHNPNVQVQELKKQNQRQAKILRYKALLYEKNNQLNIADKYYQEALNFDNHIAHYYNYIAFLINTKSDIKKIEKFSRLTLLQSNGLLLHALISYNLGNLHFNPPTFHQAQQEFSKALELFRILNQEKPKFFLPKIGKSLWRLGMIELMTGFDKDKAAYKLSEAAKIYKDLAENNPNIFALDYAQILLSSGNYTRQDISKLIKILDSFSENHKRYEEIQRISKILKNLINNP